MGRQQAPCGWPLAPAPAGGYPPGRMDPYLAVVNPAAGGGRCGKMVGGAVARLRDSGVEVEVVETQGPGEATEIVRKARAEGRTRFVVGGGDGTGYELVNGLFPAPGGSSDAAGDGPEDATEAPSEDAPAKPRLGFLPLGTGNSFLRDFTTEGAEHSIGALAEDRSRGCDVMRLRYEGGDGKGMLHFINLMSIGFVADVNGLRARRFKRWGELGYIAAVVLSVLGLRPKAYPMQLDDGERDEEPMVFASFNNSKFTGGKMMMAPHADTADGKIAVVRAGPLGRISLLRTFPKIFKGTHVDHPAVTDAQAKHIDFHGTEEIDVMIDGEALQLIPRRLEVLPNALDVVV